MHDIKLKYAGIEQNLKLEFFQTDARALVTNEKIKRLCQKLDDWNSSYKKDAINSKN